MQSCPALSCPVLSCPVLSYLVLSCPVLSCPVLSCPVQNNKIYFPLYLEQGLRYCKNSNSFKLLCSSSYTFIRNKAARINLNDFCELRNKIPVRISYITVNLVPPLPPKKRCLATKSLWKNLRQNLHFYQTKQKKNHSLFFWGKTL